MIFALLTVGTIIFLIIHNSSVIPDYEISNFLSFFTIQSNLLAAVVLLCGALGFTGRWPARVADQVRGAAAVSMATTGVVYGLLLVGYVGHLLLMSWLTVTIGNTQRQLRQRAAGLPGQPGNVESMI